MRAAYTSAVIVKMLGLGWKFPHVSGISAGSSLTANYISRDPERTRLSFTDFVADPDSATSVPGWQGVDILTASTSTSEPPSPIKPSPLISSPSARQVRLSASARPVPATAGRSGSLARI